LGKESNAIIDPRAMVVVVEHAPIAFITMLSVWRLNPLTLLALLVYNFVNDRVPPEA
jgi:hypothetical protein